MQEGLTLRMIWIVSSVGLGAISDVRWKLNGKLSRNVIIHGAAGSFTGGHHFCSPERERKGSKCTNPIYYLQLETWLPFPRKNLTFVTASPAGLVGDVFVNVTQSSKKASRDMVLKYVEHICTKISKLLLNAPGDVGIGHVLVRKPKGFSSWIKDHNRRDLQADTKRIGISTRARRRPLCERKHFPFFLFCYSIERLLQNIGGGGRTFFVREEHGFYYNDQGCQNSKWFPHRSYSEYSI
jgi:hypothetical protein